MLVCPGSKYDSFQNLCSSLDEHTHTSLSLQALDSVLHLHIAITIAFIGILNDSPVHENYKTLECFGSFYISFISL